MHRKSAGQVIKSNLIGLLIFVIIVYIANLIKPIMNLPAYSEVVSFVNSNMTFLIVMSVIFAIGEIFFALIFPFNLPGPLFSTIGSIFLVTFIGRIFNILGYMVDIDLIEAFRILSFIVYPLVFLGVLIGGYISIFAALLAPGKPAETRKENISRHTKREPTWSDIGDEFRSTIFDFFSMLRRKFNGK